MNLQLSGLMAVGTGGSAGIGAAIVRQLAEEGCNVAFCARDPLRLASALAACQGFHGAGGGVCIEPGSGFCCWRKLVCGWWFDRACAVLGGRFLQYA